MKSGNESVFLAKSFSLFINSYAPDHLTESEPTLKSYTSTLNKYLGFLEDQKGYSVKTLCRNCFERPVIEEWLRYMHKDEHLSAETCNVRLGVGRRIERGTEIKFFSTQLSPGNRRISTDGSFSAVIKRIIISTFVKRNWVIRSQFLLITAFACECLSVL